MQYITDVHPSRRRLPLPGMPHPGFIALNPVPVQKQDHFSHKDAKTEKNYNLLFFISIYFSWRSWRLCERFSFQTGATYCANRFEIMRFINIEGIHLSAIPRMVRLWRRNSCEINSATACHATFSRLFFSRFHIIVSRDSIRR
ncbi:MAG: hypothetical protein KZQ99_21680 [Candidatus Thiodiazotropha sp. (ex Dulcina madagascariensis)]|nr:hypothetical protein [Candidatus Thiodiazotropha sp. (ex Dulcina madagascariensis)]